MPGMAQSPAYAVAAETLSRASCRTTRWPTTRRSRSRTIVSATALAAPRAARGARVILDCVQDLSVARAAAEVALEGSPQRLAVGAGVTLDEGQSREEHPRRAEAALHGAVPQERELQRVQLTLVTREGAHGGDGAAAQRRGQHQAARHGTAVQEHGARAAHALV